MRRLLCAFVGAAMLGGATVVAANDAELDARLDAADQGADTINVSAYPAALQEAYRSFADKCAQCHTLSRPINSTYALPDEWQRYVKRMMRKPDSGISSSEAKLIYEFLVVDASVRRAELLERKLSALSAEDRAGAEKKVREIRESYGIRD